MFLRLITHRIEAELELPLPLAEAPVFFTVTVHGPLPMSRVELAPTLPCVVTEHLMVRSCELLSLLTTFTASAGDVATAVTMASETSRRFMGSLR